jgi:hypothetical protein
MKLYPNIELEPKINRTTHRAVLGATILATAVSLMPSELTAADVPSHVNELLALTFASQYVTPRGMMVHQTGLTFEPLELTFINLYKSDTAFVNDVTLGGGAWADFTSAGESIHAPYGSGKKTTFTEVDPIGDLSICFLKNFTADFTYSAFAEQILDIGSSQNFQAKLSYDDTKYLGAYAIHPYFAFWDELSEKATDADVPEAVLGPSPFSGAHPQPGPSYYFDVGIDPSYTFSNGIKVEAPCRVMLPDDRFYGDYYAPSSTVGLWELGLKGTIPLKFMPDGYGHWAFNCGVNYLYYEDVNLVDLQTFNAPQKPTRDALIGYAGVSLFF